MPFSIVLGNNFFFLLLMLLSYEGIQAAQKDSLPDSFFEGYGAVVNPERGLDGASLLTQSSCVMVLW